VNEAPFTREREFFGNLLGRHRTSSNAVMPGECWHPESA